MQKTLYSTVLLNSEIARLEQALLLVHGFYFRLIVLHMCEEKRDCMHV